MHCSTGYCSQEYSFNFSSVLVVVAIGASVFLELPGGSVIDDHLERVVAAWLWDSITGSADSGQCIGSTE
jgi:hypothetical protein